MYRRERGVLLLGMHRSKKKQRSKQEREARTKMSVLKVTSTQRQRKQGKNAFFEGRVTTYREHARKTNTTHTLNGIHGVMSLGVKS